MNLAGFDGEVAAAEGGYTTEGFAYVFEFEQHGELLRISQMMGILGRVRVLVYLAVASTLLAANDAASCQRKFDEIKNDRAKPGSVYTFTPAEINAWSRWKLPQEIPQGMREPSVQFGNNSGTGRALIDLLKMQHAKGAKPNWLIEKLIEGERPMAIGVAIQSGGGYATVKLLSVEISGVRASGGVLDFLIRTFFRPLYPEAHIDEKFEMGNNVERLEIYPDRALVYLKKTFGPAQRAQK
ncbi:hypothetical protein F183_A34830 [Bryobacterales bacterium F-183]|nr:hypothetical protein F183_A34830 [Bryobacterales bacterium F-183]